VPKNKGKYKSQQPAVTPVEPTEAVLDFWGRIAKALHPHRTPLLLLVGLAATVLIGLSIYSWVDRRREEGATSGFEEAIRAEKGKIQPAEPSPTDFQMPGEDPTLPKYKTADERATAALAALEKLSKDYGSSDVAKRAGLLKAGALYDLGRYDQAANAYSAAMSSADGALKFVAREGLALSIEAKALAEKDAAARNAGLDKALAEYKQLQPDEKGYYHDVAVYHQARVLSLKGDKKGAAALFQQIVDKMPSSSIVGEARERLALLEE
jgi:hypothetical protein